MGIWFLIIIYYNYYLNGTDRNSKIFSGMHIKLCDFGLSRSKTHASVTWAGDIGAGGTFPYMAPEVLVGVPGKEKMKGQPCSDVWGMCCTLIELYTGQHPWMYQGDEDLKKQVKRKQKAQQQPEQLAVVSESAKRLLAQGLNYKYHERPTAIDMKVLFEKIIAAGEAKEGQVTCEQAKTSQHDSGVCSADIPTLELDPVSDSSDEESQQPIAESGGKSVRRLTQMFEGANMGPPAPQPMHRNPPKKPGIQVIAKEQAAVTHDRHKASAPMPVDEIAASNIVKKSNSAIESKYPELKNRTYQELRDVINTSTDVDLLEACRDEFQRRLKIYRTRESTKYKQRKAVKDDA